MRGHLYNSLQVNCMSDCPVNDLSTQKRQCDDGINAEAFRVHYEVQRQEIDPWHVFNAAKLPEDG